MLHQLLHGLKANLEPNCMDDEPHEQACARAAALAGSGADADVNAFKHRDELVERLPREVSVQLHLAAPLTTNIRLKVGIFRAIEQGLRGGVEGYQFVHGACHVASMVMIGEPIHGVKPADRVVEDRQNPRKMGLQRNAIEDALLAVDIAVVLFFERNLALSFEQSGEHLIALGGR